MEKQAFSGFQHVLSRLCVGFFFLLIVVGNLIQSIGPNAITKHLFYPAFALADYVGIQLGWSMFAPEPWREDVYFSVKVIFKNGKEKLFQFPSIASRINPNVIPLEDAQLLLPTMNSINLNELSMWMKSMIDHERFDDIPRIARFALDQLPKAEKQAASKMIVYHISCPIPEFDPRTTHPLRTCQRNELGRFSLEK